MEFFSLNEKVEHIINLPLSFSEKLTLLLLKVEEHSFETKEHIDNVGKMFSKGMEKIKIYCSDFQLKGVNELRETDIMLAAEVHDIGKLFIPLNILHKKDKLSYDEWKVIEQHPVKGSELIQKTFNITLEQGLIKPSDEVLFKLAYDVSLYHHKTKFDGYPSNVEIKDIPCYVEFLRLCDIYDALKRKRSYKESMERNEILKIIYSLEDSLIRKKIFHLFIELEDDFYASF